MTPIVKVLNDKVVKQLHLLETVLFKMDFSQKHETVKINK